MYPDNVKPQDKGKGFHREIESERSQMLLYYFLVFLTASMNAAGFIILLPSLAVEQVLKRI